MRSSCPRAKLGLPKLLWHSHSGQRCPPHLGEPGEARPHAETPQEAQHGETPSPRTEASRTLVEGLLRCVQETRKDVFGEETDGILHPASRAHRRDRSVQAPHRLTDGRPSRQEDRCTFRACLATVDGDPDGRMTGGSSQALAPRASADLPASLKVVVPRFIRPGTEPRTSVTSQRTHRQSWDKQCWRPALP